MTPPPEPLFLERGSYRRRRVMDAARLLPLAGAVLFLLPELWSGKWTTAQGVFFIFGTWAALIVVSWLMSRKLAATGPEEPGEAEGGPADANGQSPDLPHGPGAGGR